ncbi:MAG: tRNA (N(6)-L-threonylcarbamoyladenosine(37)-C(2))-methylthiotransferase MtaB [Candidatus Aureabacteria bacterium]|nr:tRNA (N(6)-L-threonylcarbamoyladenosine(37)-C(2))-methylthiotransferase MtaB [Candidatus Auribacterota bacterium]
MKKLLTFSIKTLGCKVNRYESELLTENIKFLGLRQKTFPASDIILINSCSVTQRTEAKMRNEIRKAAKVKNAQLIICGCMSQTLKEAIRNVNSARITTVDTPDKVKGVIKSICKHFSGKGRLEEKGMHSILESFTGRTRAFIKIQDGCQSFCSYCIVPFMRPHIWSRDPDEIIAEILNMEKSYTKEIVLTGIHIGRYQSEHYNLQSIINKIIQETRIPRIRLSSIEPLDITDDLLRLMECETRVCPHLHIPLQSGSDSVLKKMNRAYSMQEYRSLLRCIRMRIPDISITTDIIVGFPGEKESDFEESMKALQEFHFLKVHIFPFSARPGTKAFDMPDKLPQSTIMTRTKSLSDLSGRIAIEEKKKWLGKTADVLFEQAVKNHPGFYKGFSQNYIKVIVKAKSTLTNRICRVTLTKLDTTGMLSGKILTCRFKK